MKDEDLIWQPRGKKQILETVVFSVNELETISPKGQQGLYIVQDAPDWVVVIPDLGESFLLVKQWRHALNALSIEFPGGVIDKGECPEHAARRELLEETGRTAGVLKHLGTHSPNPALMCNKVHVFLAENLSEPQEQHLDADEYVCYLEKSHKEVYEMLGTDDFPHALMTSAVALYLTHKCGQSLK